MDCWNDEEPQKVQESPLPAFIESLPEAEKMASSDKRGHVYGNRLDDKLCSGSRVDVTCV
jgi:hypothetical protein